MFNKLMLDGEGSNLQQPVLETGALPIELPTNREMWACRGLNPGPSDYESAALTN